MRIRTFLLLACACLGLEGGDLFADAFDDLRLKWRDAIVGSGYDPEDPLVVSRLNGIASTATANLNSMDRSAERTFLWSDTASPTVSSHITRAYSRLEAMALAYATPGCPLQGDAGLLEATLDGLDWMHANRYNPSVSIYGNWWDFEIGSPNRLVDIAVLLYDQLDTTRLNNYLDAVDKFTPSATTPAPGGTSGTFTGANRMDKIRIVSVRGAVVKDNAKLVNARDALSNLFDYVDSGDGFYRDGSFIQHNYHPYTASYGTVLINGIAEVMGWLDGSNWEVIDPDRANVFQWVFDSYEPILYRGAALEFVRGRSITRGSGATPQSAGHSIMDAILRIAQFAPAPEALRMKRMLKEWIISDTVGDFVAGRPLRTLALAQGLMADESILPRGESTVHYSFPRMDRVLHLGEGYGFGISMCSSRIANFESINGENLKGWFTGDGMNLLYNADLDQFGDQYWATVDAYRLPGVTADVTHDKLPHQTSSLGLRAQGQSTRSPHDWVGGAVLGRFGAAGMEFKGVDVSLTGRKSWFLFDDEIVCLGAGIQSTDSRPIETTVENRRLADHGLNPLTVDSEEKPAALGWTEGMTDITWAHLAGTASGADIGYFFPGGTAVRGVREARTGSWADVDDERSDTPYTRNYLRLTLEHGANPSDAGYAYVLLPGRSARRVGLYAEAPQIEILVNNAAVQAVRETTLGLTAANFWTDTMQSAGGITVDRKACVLVRRDGPFIEVALSNPTQRNSGSVHLDVDLDGGLLVAADPEITVQQASPTVSLTVDVNGAQGRTFSARFYIGTPEITAWEPVADAYVYDAAASQDANFGNATSLVVKKSGTGFNRAAFLRFDVPAVPGTVLGAALRLHCLSAAEPGDHGVFLVPDNAWTESGAGGVTWNSQPSAEGNALATWTPQTGNPVTLDVSTAVQGAGLHSFKVEAVTQTSNGYVTYAARENGSEGDRPQLILTRGFRPPDIRLVQPADGAFLVETHPVTLVAEPEAGDHAIVRVDFLDGQTVLGSASSPPFQLTTPLSGGPHGLRAVAVDAHGLTRTSLVSRVDLAHTPVANATGTNTPAGQPIDIDLRAWVQDADTPLAELRFSVGAANHGTVALLADGFSARFTPEPGYDGPASFEFQAMDNTPDSRLLFNYDFRSDNSSDASGQGRHATINLQGNGTVDNLDQGPVALAPQLLRSVRLHGNGLDGAARIERNLDAGVLDLAAADWSIAGWFRRESETDQDSLVQLGESGGYASDALTLAFYGSGSSLLLRNYDGTTKDVEISAGGVAAGQWHHFAIVRSGTTLAWYLNGNLVGSDTDFHFGFDNAKPLKFGGVTSSANFLDRWWNGTLADLGLFGSALDAAEIGQLQNTPIRWLAGQSTGTAVAMVDVLGPFRQWTRGGGLTAANEAADADPDGDGRTNWEEYLAGTPPNSFDPGPQLGIQMNGGEARVIFQAAGVGGVGYAGLVRYFDLLCTTNGLAGPWWGVPGFTNLVGAGQAIQMNEAPQGPETYYKLRLRLE